MAKVKKMAFGGPANQPMMQPPKGLGPGIGSGIGPALLPPGGPGPGGMPMSPGAPVGAAVHPMAAKKGGKVKVKKMAKGGSVSSASKRADGIATKGKTKGRYI
mgnify:CR=1 FL=1